MHWYLAAQNRVNWTVHTDSRSRYRSSQVFESALPPDTDPSFFFLSVGLTANTVAIFLVIQVKLNCCCRPLAFERTASPKRKFCTGCSCAFARTSWVKTSVGTLESLRNKHAGADIHDLKVQTYTTPGRGFKKFSKHNLGLIFQSL